MTLLNPKKLRMHFTSLWSQSIGAKVYSTKGKQPCLINKDLNLCLIYKNIEN